MKKLSIVIPVYNSEKTLKVLLSKIDEVIKNKFDYEVVLVNDYSKDNSLDVIKNLSSNNPKIKAISFSKNFGQHNALMAGFHFYDAEYVMCMDDDLQNPPEEILNMLNAIENSQYDVIFAKYIEHKEKGFKKFGSQVNNLMANFLVDKPNELYLTSLYIMKKFVVDEMIRYGGPYPYIGGLMFRITKNIGVIEVEHRERKCGKSNYNLKKSISLWLNGFTSFSVKPLRISSVLGLIFSSLSFFYIIYIIIRKFMYPSISVGWTSIMAAITFFGGIQLLSIGLIGEYVGRIYISINKKPQYVIKEKININNK